VDGELQQAELESIDRRWSGVYKAGGAAALMLVAITLAEFVTFILVQPPVDGSAGDWFALFQKSALLGLLGFESLLVIYALLSVLVSVALFAALRPASPSLSAIFLVLSVIGSMAFVMARPALEMLYLSNQHAAATTEAQRAALLAAGEAMVAVFHGTAFQVSYILGSITGLLIAAAMLRSDVFSRATAYLRIGSSVLDFGIYIPGIGLFISLFSVLFLLAFNLLVGRRLLQLGSSASKTGGQ
jgi:hypothetical protein